MIRLSILLPSFKSFKIKSVMEHESEWRWVGLLIGNEAEWVHSKRLEAKSNYLEDT